MKRLYIAALDVLRYVRDALPKLPDLYVDAGCPVCGCEWQQSMRYALDKIALHENAALYVECPNCSATLTAHVDVAFERTQLRKVDQ